MDRSPILVLIFVGIFIAVVILVYSSVMGTMSVTQRIFDSDDSSNSLIKNLKPGYFSINSLRYYDRLLAEAGGNTTEIYTDRCSMNETKETLIIELLLNSLRHPDKCDLYIDKRFKKQFSIEDLPKKTIKYNNALDEVVFFPIVLHDVDIYSPHTITVCCSDICHDDSIERLCSKVQEK